MNLLTEILAWSEKTLPLWQRDALRRLFQQQGSLLDKDYEELLAILKSENKFPLPPELVPNPLSKSHLPTVSDKDTGFYIVAIRDLKYVNRIALEQNLPFCSNGMTIVYGDNGSGKSGFARVMKRACRARDQSEKIHSNVTDPSQASCTPEAFFDVNINGESKSYKWVYGTNSADELSLLSVFDSHCARAYLTAEQEVAYLPYGLDILESLANVVIPTINSRLEKDINSIDVNREPFSHLTGETPVGKLVTSLSHDTDINLVNSLGVFSGGDNDRLEAISKALGEGDPSARSAERKLSYGRIKALIEKLNQCESLVSEKEIVKLKNSYDEVAVSNQEEVEAAEALRAGESLLPGTGDKLWKTMFEAARKFAKEIAYSGEEFPPSAEGALCPLCQEPLNAGRLRLQRFEDYIQQDIAKRAEEVRSQLQAKKQNLKDANLGLEITPTLAQELDELKPGITNSCIQFENSLKDRRRWMLERLDAEEPDKAPVFYSSPLKELRTLATKQLLAARTYSQVSSDADRNRLAKEQEALSACKVLSECKPAILSLIDRMKTKHTLEACKSGVKTKPISDKSRELASSAVSEQLSKALDSEFQVLGAGHIKTKLAQRNEKGKTKLRLLLDVPSATKIDEILSEGEQRAIALGSFLAELSLSSHSFGIVFDDPVSSLDHYRREKVAKRLAQESLKRQVIIFTHDVVFLYLLQEECKNFGAPFHLAYLENRGGNAGNICAGLPWDHQGYAERIDNLEKAQRRLEKLPWPPDPSDDLKQLMRHSYSQFRATIERVVQDVALSAIVRRFERYIRVTNLAGIVGTEQAEVDDILKLYQRCNDIVDGHDPASAMAANVPSAAELKKDIDDLKNVIERIKERRKRQA